MRRRFLVGLLATVFALAVPLAVLGDVTVAPGGGTPGTLQNFQLVGHNDLFARGMNAAPALCDHYVYVGNRTDGSLSCSETGGVQPCHASANVHIHPGVLIVDVADPSDPTVVGELGPPYAALPGITTRELRVWPEKKLLMIMTFRCSSAIHDCPPGTDSTFPFDIKFFDLSDPVHPAFISSYVPISQAGQAVKPHEMLPVGRPEEREPRSPLALDALHLRQPGAAEPDDRGHLRRSERRCGPRGRRGELEPALPQRLESGQLRL